MIGSIEQFFSEQARRSSSAAPEDGTQPAEPMASGPVPAPGEHVMIRDTETGQAVLVRFQRVFKAASGRKCSYYFDVEGSLDAKDPSGLACQDDEGRWTRIPLRLNTDRQKVQQER